MFYGSAEEKRNHIQERINTLREAAAQTNRVKDVVRRFDGKTYNCKFDDAISALTDDNNRFYVSNQYGWLYIQFCHRHGYNNTISLMAAYSCKSNDYIEHQTRDEYKVFNGKRIKADAMIARLNTERAELLKEAYELECAMEALDKTLEQISSLKHAVNHIIDGLPYTIRDTYGIKAC